MRIILPSRFRHPLFPKLRPTAAKRATGAHPVLTGTFAHLMSARIRGATAERALFVVSRVGRPWISDAERDILWQQFEVPILGLLVDDRGEILAYECEAQCLHVGAKCIPPSAGVLDETPCDCGRPGQRLTPAGSENRSLTVAAR